MKRVKINDATSEDLQWHYDYTSSMRMKYIKIYNRIPTMYEYKKWLISAGVKYLAIGFA
ncbi:MAG: hypothetical protein ACTSPI_14080 [Candidatus Heimdallarchaeaceae archaeon]